ncbi:DHA2 family efflux MFS transporter permease subunit [Streptomyces sp. AJS327]|uniref:MFS transporter n=1 Tax=Streptomyces sp. AJS327 TaxID=2545265 RepID=UPI0015DD7EF3|nr:MFS transporter [Streptomyces sp. AJS327]MBA0053338.1 DHA2 family efflux MFS transporter permease subunit [Streptomyces sp. AJS327]
MDTSLTKAGPGPAARASAGVALAVTCGAQFMVIVDDTVVAMALPTLRTDLGFQAADLAWVIDAYMLLFGGFLVLGGRCADLFGRRRTFLTGLTVFTIASFAAGIAGNPGTLIAARGLQGFGAALLSPAALSILITVFTEPTERRKALGIWGGLTGVSGVSGVLLGGVITDAISWRWVFFVNIPIGVLLFALAMTPGMADREARPRKRSLGDSTGALLITSSLLLLVYSVISTAHRPWTDVATILGLVTSALLMIAFILRELRVPEPLIRLGIFANRQISVANVMMVLAASGLYGIFFFLTQYMQNVQGWSPMRAGLSWAPFGLTMAVFSGLAIQLLPRAGSRLLCLAGLSSATLGLGLLQRAPVDADYVSHILPTLLLCAAGYGLALVPLVVAAVSGVAKADSGAASGVLNTGQQIGGAVGLAILATLASSKLDDELAAGEPQLEALLTSFHSAFLVGTVLTACAALLSLALPALRTEFDPETTQGV